MKAKPPVNRCIEQKVLPKIVIGPTNIIPLVAKIKFNTRMLNSSILYTQWQSHKSHPDFVLSCKRLDQGQTNSIPIDGN